jgi:hypothetical protein
VAIANIKSIFSFMLELGFLHLSRAIAQPIGCNFNLTLLNLQAVHIPYNEIECGQAGPGVRATRMTD